jgi:thiamine pyrophosphate-dependent acetolactate synthase large subunit-like protein
VVTDGGRFVAQPIKLLDVPHPSALIYTFSFGSIGLGTGAAIGAAVASPGSPVLFVAGDGGFMSGGLNEFHTAVRENLDLILVLCNDGSYGAEHLHFRARGMDPSLSMFDWPDFAPVADALGGRGVTVCSLADLDVAEQAIAERDRPLLIDLKLDPDQVPRLL